MYIQCHEAVTVYTVLLYNVQCHHTVIVHTVSLYNYNVQCHEAVTAYTILPAIAIQYTVSSSSDSVHVTIHTSMVHSVHIIIMLCDSAATQCQYIYMYMHIIIM